MLAGTRQVVAGPATATGTQGPRTPALCGTGSQLPAAGTAARHLGPPRTQFHTWKAPCPSSPSQGCSLGTFVQDPDPSSLPGVPSWVLLFRQRGWEAQPRNVVGKRSRVSPGLTHSQRCDSLGIGGPGSAIPGRALGQSWRNNSGKRTVLGESGCSLVSYLLNYICSTQSNSVSHWGP